MPRISPLVSGEDLAIIDAAAWPNGSTFIVTAAREAAARIRRARVGAEVAAAVAEFAEDDLELARVELHPHGRARGIAVTARSWAQLAGAAKQVDAGLRVILDL